MELSQLLRQAQESENERFFETLRRAILFEKRAVLPSSVFELCQSSGDTMASFMSSPDVIARLAPDLKPVNSADLDRLHSSISKLSGVNACRTEVAIIELVDRIYATVNIDLNGFDALLRVASDSKSPSARHNAVAGIVQHFSRESDLLLLAFTQVADLDLVSISQAILPYSGAAFAALRAEQLLTQFNPLTLNDQRFVYSAKRMWWKYSGINHFSADEGSAITTEEFLERFEVYTQDTFPGKDQVLELSHLIADVLSDDMTEKGAQLDKLGKSQIWWAEAILAMAIRRPSAKMQVFCLEKLSELSPSFARFEASRLSDSPIDAVRIVAAKILENW